MDSVTCNQSPCLVTERKPGPSARFREKGKVGAPGLEAPHRSDLAFQSPRTSCARRESLVFICQNSHSRLKIQRKILCCNGTTLVLAPSPVSFVPEPLWKDRILLLTFLHDALLLKLGFNTNRDAQPLVLGWPVTRRLSEVASVGRENIEFTQVWSPTEGRSEMRIPCPLCCLHVGSGKLSHFRRKRRLLEFTPSGLLGQRQLPAW